MFVAILSLCTIWFECKLVWTEISNVYVIICEKCLTIHFEDSTSQIPSLNFDKLRWEKPSYIYIEFLFHLVGWGISFYVKQTCYWSVTLCVIFIFVSCKAWSSLCYFGLLNKNSLGCKFGVNWVIVFNMCLSLHTKLLPNTIHIVLQNLLNTLL